VSTAADAYFAKARPPGERTRLLTTRPVLATEPLIGDDRAMAPLDSIVAASAYVAAAFGLAGSADWRHDRRHRQPARRKAGAGAAERSWMRDSRRAIYDRFLTNAQKLLIACEGSGP
jgi:hypothetical protein